MAVGAMLPGFLGAHKVHNSAKFASGPVARASRPWGVYILAHGRDGHATKIRLVRISLGDMRHTRYV